jgi:molybdopterin-binding protein
VTHSRSTDIRIKDAADLLGVSDDTVRRWIDSGALAAAKDVSGRTVVAGEVLAAFARDYARAPSDPTQVESSARNRLVGLVTAVTSDAVMSEVEMQCGPFTVVSLMSSRSVQSLGIEPGRVAVAVIKATTVIVETPKEPK